MRHRLDRARVSVFAAALLAVVTLALAACGSESSTPATQPTEVAQTVRPTVTPEPTETPAPPPATATAVAATPTPVPTASPTPAATATATPAPAAVEGSAEGLVSDLAERAWSFLVELSEEHSPRESATQQELAAAEFLLGELREMGLRAELQPFAVEVLAADPPVFSLADSPQSEIRAFPMSDSGTGTVSALVAEAGRALPGDVTEELVRGKIALVERGAITFQEKADRLAVAGALAVVVYNDRPGPFGGQLSSQAQVPVISISQGSGVTIKSLLAQGDVSATVSVVMETRDSRNVVAEMPGSSEDGGVVVLGGHYDTVPGVQGANDNGSGTATLLAVAEHVSQGSYPFAVRFIAFGSEELGLRGSAHYVRSLTGDERQNIVAMLNFDALGSGEGVEVLGSIELVNIAIRLGTSSGIEVTRSPPLDGASSDHASFIQAGVPAVFLVSGELSRIHTPDDVLAFVRPELMGASGALGIGLLDELAAVQ